ncbi:MAG: TRAP transporter TatT component family protein [Proteobacteria bacterium]|nr:TRAP transporter TatT component family protein [Pseudomonadota bacterium]
MTNRFMGIRHGVSLIILSILIAGLSGCTALRGKMIDMGANASVDDLVTASYNMPSARLAKEGIPGQVFMVTQVTDGMAPTSYKMLVTCSTLYMTYGLLVEDEDPEYAVVLYNIGKEYGIRALKQNRKVKKYLDQGFRFSQPLQSISEMKKEKGEKFDFKKDVKRLVDYADEDDIEALFYTGTNMVLSLFVRSMQLGDMSATIDIADVMALVKRVNTLDPEYFFGFGQLLVAGYKAFIPPVFDPEGGIENAEKAFEKASNVSDGNLLMVDYFKAKLLATAKKDPVLFDHLVERILTADPAILKGGTLLNAIAQEKTTYLKKQRKELFP